MTAKPPQTPATPQRRPSKRKLLTIGVVIQARMTSQRFPGKSMALLREKPVLQHVIERCKAIKSPFGFSKPLIVVAMPDDPASEPMGQLAQRMKVDHFVGSETNVLERYYHAARFFNLDFIVRITADCPFISPIICQQVLHLLIWRKCDYVSNCYPTIDRTFPKGLDCEAFTMDCLEAAHVIVEQEYEKYTRIKSLGKEKFDVILKQLDYCREHVTPWMVEEPQLKRAMVKQKVDHSDLNWCIDTPEDITRLEAMYEEIMKMHKNNANDNTTDTKKVLH